MNVLLRSGLVLNALACIVAASAADITDLKPLYPRTDLIVEGRARCVIVVSADATLRAQAEALAAALPVRPEILTDTDLVSPRWEIDFDTIGGRNLVALGNINTNRLLAVLYGETWVVVDSLFPGPGGYVIRTVHDPWAAGVNVLVLAGSDDDGVARAVAVFRERYLQDTGDVILPQPVVDVEFTPVEYRFFPFVDNWSSSKRQPQFSTIEYFRDRFAKSGLMDDGGNVQRLDEGNLMTVIGAVGRIAQSWFWTGDPDLPPLMKQIVDVNRHLLAVVPRRIEMEGSAAAWMHWWDVVEELPVWTDRDRLDIVNAFYADARQGYERRAANEMVKEGYVQVVDENHGTNSALNTFRGWRYFEKYYDLPETAYWMSVARATFAGQCASHQTLEDACGYLAYAPEDTMEYALADRDLRYFDLGIARTQAEFIANCCVNNLGLGTGFGDSSGLVYPGTFQAVARAAWYYRDPRLSWTLQNHFHTNCGLRVFQNALPFDLTVPAREPTEWTGMCLFPIWKQTLRKGEGSKHFITDPREPIGPEWFNKIVFREGWGPDDQYLLLDGAGKWPRDETEGYANRGPSGHKHDDVNTIINFTDEGRMWLVDHTYGSARSIKDHSGLYIVRDGQVSYRVREARLRDFAQAGELALCRSVFENFSGADWERTIFWRRGEWFLVMDRAVAREAGDYQVRCSFRGLGEAELRGDTMRLTQDGRFCDITADGRGALDIVDFVFPAQNHWESFYPWADGIARVFQQDKSAHLEPGEAITFTTLIRAASSPEALDAVVLLPCSPTAAIVSGPDGDTLCSVGPPPGMEGDAGACMISPETLSCRTRPYPAGSPRPCMSPATEHGAPSLPRRSRWWVMTTPRSTSPSHTSG
ncbi:MAG: hypothetical protein J7M38_10990 [Armatimonadetes bacterium]|nr:hypothetical protein [Armatimonadota bacterium]